jgi:hypothetical protein
MGYSSAARLLLDAGNFGDYRPVGASVRLVRLAALKSGKKTRSSSGAIVCQRLLFRLNLMTRCSHLR